MQKIILKGHIGRDAELVQIGERQQVKFSLACTEGKGERANTTWYDVLSYAVQIHPYLLRGKEVVVAGSLSIRRSTGKDGKTYTNLNVYADGVELCGGRADVQAAPQAQKRQAPPRPTQVVEDNEVLPF